MPKPERIADRDHEIANPQLARICHRNLTEIFSGNPDHRDIRILVATDNFGAQFTSIGQGHINLIGILDHMKISQDQAILGIDDGTGEMFGSLAAQLRQSGRGHEFRIQDLWLASQAVQHGLILLTHNEKDFLDIPGLRLRVLEAR